MSTEFTYKAAGVDIKEAAALVEVLARLVISYFLAPSSQYDFTNETQARAFVRAHVPFTQGAMQ